MAMPGLSRAELVDAHCRVDESALTTLRRSRWHRFVVLGDAMAGVSSPPVEGYRNVPWAERVARALEAGHDLAHLNLGRRDLLAGEVRAQQVERALRFRPDLAAVSCGGTDALRPTFDADTAEAEIARIVSALRDSGCDVVTMTTFDLSYAPEFAAGGPDLRKRLRLVSERTRAVAVRHGAMHLDLVSHPAVREATIYGRNGAFVSSRGHAVVAAAVLRRLAEHVAGECR